MGAPRPILAFEPDPIRERQLREAIATWGDGFQVRNWDCAERFCKEAGAFLGRAALIVIGGDDASVHRWLSDQEPMCKVVTAAPTALQSGGWPTIPKLARPAALPAGVDRMKKALLGLALGDSLGEMLCHSAQRARERLAQLEIPGTFYHTDDTEMAVALSSVLRAHGQVDQDALAARFVRRFQLDPDRGYGKMTRLQLQELARGGDWRQQAEAAFGGQGSMGNGSAMRVAPLGAYFAEDLELCARQARLSSEVTHTHPEALAGAVAVALAAAQACRSGTISLLEIARFVPDTDVGQRLVQAEQLSGCHLQAARVLGCGRQVTAQDTVPFCLWLAARSDDYVEAIGCAIEADGDCDTCAAIIGALLALRAPHSLPTAWTRRLDPSLRLY